MMEFNKNQSLQPLPIQFAMIGLALAWCFLSSIEFGSIEVTNYYGWLTDFGIYFSASLPIFLIMTILKGQYQPAYILSASLLSTIFYGFDVPESIIRFHIAMFYDEPNPLIYSPIKITVFVHLMAMMCIIATYLTAKYTNATRIICLSILAPLSLAGFAYHTYGFIYNDYHTFAHEEQYTSMDMEQTLLAPNFPHNCENKREYNCVSWKEGERFPYEKMDTTEFILELAEQYELDGWANPFYGKLHPNGFNKGMSSDIENTIRKWHWKTYRFYKDREIGVYKLIAFDHTYRLHNFTNTISVIFCMITLFWFTVGAYLLTRHDKLSRRKVYPESNKTKLLACLGGVFFAFLTDVGYRFSPESWYTTVIYTTVCVCIGFYFVSKRSNSTADTTKTIIATLSKFLVVIIPNVVLLVLLIDTTDLWGRKENLLNVSIATMVFYVAALISSISLLLVKRVSKESLALFIGAFGLFVPALALSGVLTLTDAASNVVKAIAFAFIGFLIVKSSLNCKSAADKIVVAASSLTTFGAMSALLILTENSWITAKMMASVSGKDADINVTLIENSGLLLFSLSLQFLLLVIILVSSLPKEHFRSRK